MGYMHINNLYKDREILDLFKECYALEKIHGTSAHIAYGTDKGVTFFSGGEAHDRFIKLFDAIELLNKFNELFAGDSVVVYGEAYGGKQQGMSATYGTNLRFVVFDVKVNESWLAVPNAHDIATKLGLEFVHYNRIPCTVEAVNAERDAPSVQAVRNGIVEPKIREGVVLRPLIELTKNNGSRIITKHKRDEFMETAKPRRLETDPVKLAVLTEAQAIADEWITPMRLVHVLDKIGNPSDLSKTPDVIKAMLEDVKREASQEIQWSKEAERAIGKATAALFKKTVCPVLT